MTVSDHLFSKRIHACQYCTQVVIGVKLKKYQFLDEKYIQVGYIGRRNGRYSGRQEDKPYIKQNFIYEFECAYVSGIILILVFLDFTAWSKILIEFKCGSSKTIFFFSRIRVPRKTAVKFEF